MTILTVIKKNVWQKSLFTVKVALKNERQLYGSYLIEKLQFRTISVICKSDFYSFRDLDLE